MVPNFFEDMFDGPENLPYWMTANKAGYIFYLTIISVRNILINNVVRYYIPNLYTS